MGYKAMLPSASLKKYILNIWEGEIKASDNQMFKHIATASISPQLLFYYKGGFRQAADPQKSGFSAATYFFGPTNQYGDYITNENAAIFGIQFYPYAIPYLFSLPSEELINETVELRLLLGNKGHELEERIFTSRNFKERAGIISEFFETRLKEIAEKDKNIISTIHFINKAGGVLKTENLAREAHLSERQFERNFKTLTGFSPKSYARIVRFENALNNFLDNTQPLTDVALASGYYDQAHFNHDFKHFTGYTPTAYYQSVTELAI
jgi:AraC-like DNA-binding protein